MSALRLSRRNVDVSLVSFDKSRYRSLRGFERFYEKVIKVKADVAALLSLFSDVSRDVRW